VVSHDLTSISARTGPRYLTGHPEHLEAAHSRVIAAGGARLWNHFRGCGHAAAASPESSVYFEWSMGPANAAVDLALAVGSWESFAREVLTPK